MKPKEPTLRDHLARAGRSRSPRKAAAVRLNGAKGGRPSKVVAIARNYWRGLTDEERRNKDHLGWVIIFRGEIDGWKRYLDKPEANVPGCLAVPVLGGPICVSADGDDYGGAKVWVATEDEAPALGESKRITAGLSSAQIATALEVGIQPATPPRQFGPQTGFLRDSARDLQMIAELPQAKRVFQLAEIAREMVKAADELDRRRAGR